MNLSEIAKIVQGTVIGDSNRDISGVAPFEHAGETDITFAETPALLKQISRTRAGAILVPYNFSLESPPAALINVENPKVAFIKVIRLFHPQKRPEGISPGSHVGKNFKCGDHFFAGTAAVIGDDVTVGDRVAIHPNAVIGTGVVIGSDVEIFPNVTILDRCIIGSRVTIQASTVIGSDGFGFAPDGDTYRKIPHLGIVQIDDDVEIGAGCTIDRGTFGKTHICRGVKTDNLVHIAHNVIVGEDTLLVAQVGIAGSVTIGKHAILAGQVGVSGHITIGDNVTVGAQSGIAKSIPNGEIVSGSPEMPHKLWLRVQRLIPRLPEFVKRLSELEKKVS